MEGTEGGAVNSEFWRLNSASLSMVRHTELRMNSHLFPVCGDGKRTVFTTDGGCVKNGSSSSETDDRLSARGEWWGWRNMAMATVDACRKCVVGRAHRERLLLAARSQQRVVITLNALDPRWIPIQITITAKD